VGEDAQDFSVRGAFGPGHGGHDFALVCLGDHHQSPEEPPPPPPLTAAVMGPAEKVAKAMWGEVPIIPTMTTGATDGRYLNAGGIPTYGLTGMFSEPGSSGVHGLNERIMVRSLLEGRTFLYRVVKLYADGK
jgi:acetylornithine deacetylase/succinyl-diaminopimelate desuccinylase-like protein